MAGISSSFLLGLPIFVVNFLSCNKLLLLPFALKGILLPYFVAYLCLSTPDDMSRRNLLIWSLVLHNSLKMGDSLYNGLYGDGPKRETFQALAIKRPGEYSLIYAIKICAAPKGRPGFLSLFWSENGYTLCPFWYEIGYGFRGNYRSVWTYLSFQFQKIKKEREIYEFEMDFKKTFWLLF